METTQEYERCYKIPAHPLEFDDFSNQREIDIYVTEPINGINDNTGIMLIIHAAGTYAEAAYYKKLRAEWSSRYNVIAIGVNYLGTKARTNQTVVLKQASIDHMINKLTPSQRGVYLSKQDRSVNDLISFFPNMDLSREVFAYWDSPQGDTKDYCDFGYVQTMDCLYSLYYVLSLCEYYEVSINKNRIFAYGSSLGGYIAQICLRFAPSTFSLVVDSSGYINIPKHEIFPRDLGGYARYVCKNGMIIGLIPEQFYSQSPIDKHYFSPDMFQIRSLDYSKCLNEFGDLCESQIIMFHGSDDKMVNVNEKIELNKKYLQYNIKSELYCFSEKDVDGKIIKSTEHAMNADIKKLFEKYCDEYCKEKIEETKPQKQTDFDKGSIIRYDTENGYYIIDYSMGAPTIKFIRN